MPVSRTRETALGHLARAMPEYGGRPSVPLVELIFAYNLNQVRLVPERARNQLSTVGRGCRTYEARGARVRLAGPARHPRYCINGYGAQSVLAAAVAAGTCDANAVVAPTASGLK
jgi:hypothetical protein